MNTTTNQISKFLDIDAPSTANGGGEPVSIASLMAKQGSMNSGQDSPPPPINITPEKKDEPTTLVEATPVVTTTEPSNNAAVSEPPSQSAEPEKTPQLPIAAEPSKVPTLQEVLKNQQPDTVLKELGYDDNLVKFLSTVKELDPKVLNFLNTWKDKGDVTGYLKEWTTDYSKMSAEDVMRHQLQTDYPTASPQQLEALFKREVTKAYSLDSDDEMEAAEGRLLLDAKADRYRESLVQKQKDYLFPAPPEPKAPEPDNSAEVAKQEFEAYKSKVTEHPFTKNIFASNQILFGGGDEPYKQAINANELTEVLYSPEKWQQGLFEQEVLPNGQVKIHYDKPDVEKQILLAAVHKYGTKLFTDMALHYKSLGGKSVNDLIENPSNNNGGTPSPADVAPKSVAEAMARNGRFSS